MRRNGGTGRIGRMVAGLLGLALLILSAAPGLALPQGGQIADHTLHDCPPGVDGHAAIMPHPDGGARGEDHRDQAPAMACCQILLCPMLPGLPAASPVRFRPPTGPAVHAALPARRPAGIDIVPDLPPPRV